MKYIRIFINSILKKPSLYFFAFLIIFTFDRHSRYEHSKDDSGTFYSDVYDYYRFLPDIFLNDAKVSEPLIQQNRRTIGMAIMYSPAFALGHLKAKLTHQECNGYSKPYQWSVRWGSIIYVLLGLLFCRLSLLLFFSEWAVFITLVCTLFGSNLFYYTYSWGELPHSYLFFLIAAFVYCVLNFKVRKNTAFILFAALLAGMITLIRPTGIVVLLFPMFYHFNDWRQPYKLTALVRNHLFLFIGFLMLFFIPILLQMLFWKHYINTFVYYSYGKEGFFFKDPQIVNFLFSYRKGWLVYTPIMLFSLFGFFTSFKNLKSFAWFNVFFFVLVVYILSSWWEWSYGGSFGCRALIEFYAFLAFPFASFVSYCLNFNDNKPVLKYSVLLVLITTLSLLIELNLFQSRQVRLGIIHWSGMNKKAYWFCFLNDNFSKADYAYMNAIVTPPNAEKMLRGERDY